MKFLLCFCLKRNRAPSRKVSYTNSNPIIPPVTSTLFPLPSDLSSESNYEKMNNSSDDEEISINNEYLTLTTSMERDGYSKISAIRSPQTSFKDDTELYATVNKTRKTKSPIKVKIDATLPQSLYAASTNTSLPQSIPSPSLHLSGFPVVSEHSPLSLPVYTNITVNTITNNHNDISSRRRHSRYDDIKTRESVQYRDQRLKMEEEQTRPEQQFRENQHLYVNSERETINRDDIYAELDDGRTSETVYQNPQSDSYSRPSNVNEIDDDNLSERYATVIRVNNTEEQSITNSIFQEIDSMMF